MRYAVLVCALLLCARPGAAEAAAVSPAPSVPPESGLPVPVQHQRCYPSHCSCSGTRAVGCTRDCRRDRSCQCVRGRYICSLYIRG